MTRTRASSEIQEQSAQVNLQWFSNHSSSASGHVHQRVNVHVRCGTSGVHQGEGWYAHLRMQLQTTYSLLERCQGESRTANISIRATSKEAVHFAHENEYFSTDR